MSILSRSERGRLRKNFRSEYISWCAMKQRCTRSKFYRGRVTVCPRWVDSFYNFLQDMGPKPSKKHTVGRIDNNGDYTPRNCRWETIREQQRNRRSTKLVRFNGKMVAFAKLCDQHSMPYHLVFHRISRCGWTVENAVLTPKMPTGFWNKSKNKKRRRLLRNEP